MYAINKSIQDLIKLERIDADQYLKNSVQVGDREVTFDKIFIVSEHDFKRRAISSSIDALFSRDIETYMLDNKDRIDELN